MNNLSAMKGNLILYTPSLHLEVDPNIATKESKSTVEGAATLALGGTSIA